MQFNILPYLHVLISRTVSKSESTIHINANETNIQCEIRWTVQLKKKNTENWTHMRYRSSHHLILIIWECYKSSLRPTIHISYGIPFNLCNVWHNQMKYFCFFFVFACHVLTIEKPKTSVCVCVELTQNMWQSICNLCVILDFDKHLHNCNILLVAVNIPCRKM